MKSALRYLNEILTLLDKDKRKLPAMIVLFLGVSVLDLAGLGLIAPYIGLVMQPDSSTARPLEELLGFVNWNSNREDQIFLLSGLLVGIFLGKAIAALIINNFIIHFSQNQQIRLRKKLMYGYQNISYSTYLQRNSAEYIHTILQLTTQFQTVLKHLLRTTSEGIIFIAIIGLLIFENTLALAVLASVTGGTLLVYDRLFRNRMRNYGTHQNQANRQIIKSINEGIEGLKEIRILGRENYFYKLLSKNAQVSSLNERRFLLIQAIPRLLLEVVLVTFIVMLVLITVSQESSKVELLGTLGLFGVAAIRLLPISNMMATTLTVLRFNRDAISKLYVDTQNLVETKTDKTNISSIKNSFNSLQLEEVSYTYPKTERQVIKKISMKIDAGEMIGIIGGSGCGKTTLANILLGLLKPEVGFIKFNGKPIHKNLKEWHLNIGYIPQETFLVDDSLRSNVALGQDKSEIDELRLTKAIEQASLGVMVSQLPLGVDSMLGQRGAKLSGGQRQRIALARALYYKRNILVMDEATSALDEETEKEIISEIKKLKGDLTLIIISHRMNIIYECDRVYQLQQGQIIRTSNLKQMHHRK